MPRPLYVVILHSPDSSGVIASYEAAAKAVSVARQYEAATGHPARVLYSVHAATLGPDLLAGLDPDETGGVA